MNGEMDAIKVTKPCLHSMSPWSPPLFLHAGSAVGNHRRPPEAVAGYIDADPHCRPTRAHPLLLEAEEREKHDKICNRVCSEGLLSGLLLAKPENSVACKVHTFLLHSLILSVSTRIPNLSTKKLKGPSNFPPQIKYRF